MHFYWVTTVYRLRVALNMADPIGDSDRRLKGSQLGAFCPYVIVYCYLEIKLRYLKNLKLFSIRVKDLFEPIVLGRKADGLLLFLKAFSWESDLWVTWFYGKKCKTWKGNMNLIENRLSGNETWCAADNHNYMCHMCKRIFRFEL